MGKGIAAGGKFSGPRSRIAARLFPMTCRIYKPNRTLDEAGSYKELERGPATMYNSKPDIPCRLDVTRYYRQAEIYGQEAIVSDYEIHVPSDVALHHDHVIVIDDKEYQVRKLLHDDDIWRPVRSALVSRVGQGSST